MKETLIALRTENRYSQNALAKELGISRQAYIKYETGEVEPPVEIIRKLSSIFNVSYKTLIDDELKTPEQNESACKTADYGNLCVASSSPAYGISQNETSNLLQQIQSKLKLLTQEQLVSILTIVQSVNQLNSNQNPPQFSAKKRRTPGGLTGTFWMSDDFDSPLDDFKEYM